MDFSCYIPTNMIGGAGCVKAHADVFRQMGQRALIVTGARSAKVSGALDDVTAVLDQVGTQYKVFDGMRENPLISICVAAGAAARDFKADYMIAIGGGSVLDGARAASVFAVEEYEDPRAFFDLTFTHSLPLVTVGTTAGTGSEVDNMAVLTDDETGKKRGMASPLLFAKVAFCDHSYTKSMSQRQTVSTALDALCHCFESWFNTAATEPSVTAARRGAELIFPRLAQIAAGGFDPDEEELRRDLYFGSLWGGIAITLTGTGFPHPAGYALTEELGLPHGVACAVYEPLFLRTALPHLDAATQKRFLDIVGSVENCIEVLHKLSDHDITLSPDMAAETVARAAASANIQKTPGGPEGALQALEREKLMVDPEQTARARGGWLFGA